MRARDQRIQPGAIAGVCTVMALAIVLARPAFAGWFTLTSAQGLPGNKVSAVQEDALGRYWFGTIGGGIARFDGPAGTPIPSDTCQCDRDIFALLQDRSGNLWVATGQTGVVRYNGLNWVPVLDGIPSRHARALFEDKAGRVWVGTASYERAGAAHYDPGSNAWRVEFTSQSTIQAILEDSAGLFWFGTDGGGVIRYDPRTGVRAQFSNANVPEGFRSDQVRGIAQGMDGVLWFATRGGLTRFDGTTWSLVTDEEGLPGNDCTAVLANRRGEIWVGTDGYGVARFDGVRWTGYSRAHGLASNDIITLYEDSSGYLWCGTDGGGVSRFDDERWTTYNTATTSLGLRNNSVASVEADASGNTWFATAGTGVSRYDGSTWSGYTMSEGLASNRVRVIRATASGDLWFGTVGAGVSRLRPTSGEWTTFTESDGLAGNDVPAVAEDHAGNLWFGSFGGGVGRYDPRAGTWLRFTTSDGLPSNSVAAVMEDRANRIWLGTSAGLSRWDGTLWVHYTAAGTDSGLPGDEVTSLFEDSTGRIWAGTSSAGLGRYDPSTGGWSRVTRASTGGLLPSDQITALFEDRKGNVWVTTTGGVGRYESDAWRSSAPGDSLRGKWVTGMTEDASGALWFATFELGARRYEPDRLAAPITVLRSVPPRLASVRAQTASASVQFESARGHEFSFRVEGALWSPWSPDSTWSSPELIDGSYVLEARARDTAGNIDPSPARSEFELDATPPQPRITSPATGQVVRDSVLILGVVEDARLKEFRVEARPSGVGSWNEPSVRTLRRSTSGVNGVLAAWRTLDVEDGSYDVRVLALDSLGLEAPALISVVVDNRAPWADQTAPAALSATSGGDLYTADGAAHVYVPPRAFERDVVFAIEALPASSVPDSVDGAPRVLPGYRISWGSLPMRKPATLDMSLDDAGSEASGIPAVYVSRDGATWARAGGTVDPRTGRISLTLLEPARYAVFRDQGAGTEGTRDLSPITLTPRVFSPSGSYADRRVGIGFTLGSPATVTVKIYSRAGRMVREVLSGDPMMAGANLIWWDGRDRDGSIVKDGLYYIAVQALGQVQTRAVAVVK